MKKEEIIARYGEEAYERMLEQNRARNKAHREEKKANDKKWYDEHPEQAKAYRKSWRDEHSEQVIASHQEECRRGGKYYVKHLKSQRTGVQGDKNKIRMKHERDYKQYKDIIAPDSQIHHEWVPRTSEYRGVALVEAEPHQYGIIDVIQILDGKITLLTEEEVRNGGDIDG